MHGDSAREGESGRGGRGAGSAIARGAVTIEELVAALEFLDVAVMVRDLEGTVLMANAAFTEMLGYTRREVVGLNAKAFLTPDRAHMVEEANRWFREGGKRGFSGNGKMMCKDGRPLRIRISVTTLLHEDQMLVVSFIEDWTDILWSNPESGQN